jgi:hypothetical protein
MTYPRFLPIVTLVLVIGPMAGAALAASRPVSLTRPLAMPGATTPGSSESGYVVSGASGAYTAVSASWTAPAVTCTATAFASFWVGLDGYTSDSVEQIGTEADCSGKTAVYDGWYDMYPAPPVVFSSPVQPGDAISASVTFSGTQTYTLVLKDSTQGWTHTVTKNESGLARSSAEVITEGPSASGLLADFGTVSYTGCDVNGTSLGQQSPTRLVITNSSGRALDTTSPITAAGSFHNTWLRSS